jgi:hypothetical protein
VASKAKQLVAELAAAEPTPLDEFDVDGLELGSATSTPKPLKLPGSDTHSLLGKKAEGPVESMDDDFGDIGDLSLSGSGMTPARQSAPTSVKPLENNWTSEFELPDGSLKLKVSPFKESPPDPAASKRPTLP